MGTLYLKFLEVQGFLTKTAPGGGFSIEGALGADERE
jgi:hypothetical protein